MQVVHFDTQAVTERGWVLGATTNLPSQVSAPGAPKFQKPSTRATAHLARTYRYVILNRTLRPALAADRVCWIWIRSMKPHAHRPRRRSWASMISRRSAPPNVRHVRRCATCTRSTSERIGERIVLTVCANAFLHHMVRNIAGVLIAIGTGERPTGWAADSAGSTRPNQGRRDSTARWLYLAGIRYTPSLGLPSEPSDPTMPL